MADHQPTEVEILADLLRWHVDMGADWAIDDAPHDRFREDAEARAAPRPAPPPEASPQAEARRAPALADPPNAAAPQSAGRQDAERSARDTAAAAADLESLRAAYEAFEAVP